MKKNIILFGLVIIMILAGCSQNFGTRNSRVVEVNGKPVDVNSAQDYVVTVSGAPYTTISEITIIQPENSKTQIDASVENRLVEKNGENVVLTTVTIEEKGPVAGIPFYVWILLAIIVLLVIFVIIACSGGNSKSEEESKSEPEPKPEPEPQPEPKPVVAPVVAAATVAKPSESKKKTVVRSIGADITTTVVSYGGASVEVIVDKNTGKKYMPKIYGVDSIQDLINLTKNTALKTDEIQQRCGVLEIEIGEINDQLRQIDNATFPDEARRENLLQVKNDKHDVLVYLRTEGRLVETSNDDYAYLLKALTDKEPDYRETERFNEEKVISVTQYDIVWLKNHLNLK